MNKSFNPIVAIFMGKGIKVSKLRGCYRIVIEGEATIFGDTYRALYKAYLAHINKIADNHNEFAKKYFSENNIYIHWLNDYPYIFISDENPLYGDSLWDLYNKYIAYINKI